MLASPVRSCFGPEEILEIRHTIEGQSGPAIIANQFKELYAKKYVDSANDWAAVNEFYDARETLDNTNEQDISSIDVASIEVCIKLLKPCKSAGHDSIVAEHILRCHPVIVIHLKLLFTMMLTHSYVPDAFSRGVIIPVIKDKQGDFRMTLIIKTNYS